MQRKRRASTEASPSLVEQTGHASTVNPYPSVCADNSSPSREAVDRRFRELYSKPSDFKELSRLDPEFAAVFVPCSLLACYNRQN